MGDASRPPQAPIPGSLLRRALAKDAGPLLVLQRCCWVSVAINNKSLAVPALHESLDDLRAWIEQWQVYLLEVEGRIIAAIRGRARDQDWEIGRLMVAPDFEGQGLGRWLLSYCESAAPAQCRRYFLFTAPGNARGIEIYKRAGYLIAQSDTTGAGHMDGALFMCKTHE